MIVMLKFALPAYRTQKIQKKILETWFEAQTTINMVYLLLHPDTPRLYDTGVRFEREGKPEVWKDIPSILADGNVDDCEGLASWLAAELRVRDKIMGARVILRKMKTHGLWHALVYDRESKRTWDPSRVLGMGK